MRGIIYLSLRKYLFVEYLLCARHRARRWGRYGEQSFEKQSNTVSVACVPKLGIPVLYENKEMADGVKKDLLNLSPRQKLHREGIRDLTAYNCETDASTPL